MSTDSDLQSFNRFKGSIFAGSGIILILYSLFTLSGSICQGCPPTVPPRSLAQVLIPTMFFLFLLALGVFLVVSGYSTIRHGGIHWKRLSSENVAFAFGVVFVCMILADLVLYWAFG